MFVLQELMLDMELPSLVAWCGVSSHSCVAGFEMFHLDVEVLLCYRLLMLCRLVHHELRCHNATRPMHRRRPVQMCSPKLARG